MIFEKPALGRNLDQLVMDSEIIGEQDQLAVRVLDDDFAGRQEIHVTGCQYDRIALRSSPDAVRCERDVDLLLAATFHLIQINGKPGLLNRVIELSKAPIHSIAFIDTIEDNGLTAILQFVFDQLSGKNVVKLESSLAGLAGFDDITHVY